MNSAIAAFLYLPCVAHAPGLKPCVCCFGVDECLSPTLDCDKTTRLAFQPAFSLGVWLFSSVVAPDAYNDPRFDRSVDLQSGYYTRSVLCVPVKSASTVVGVIQLINKTDGVFTDDDVTLTKLMATQIGAAVRGVHDFEAAEQQHRHASDELQHLRRQLAERSQLSTEVEDDAFHTRLVLAFAGIAAAVTDVATLAKVVQADVPATVEADAAVLYIRDSTTEELWCFRCVRELSPPTLSHSCRRWVCVWRAPRLV